MKQITLFTGLLLQLLGIHLASANVPPDICISSPFPIICNDTIHIGLPTNCEVTLTPDMILEVADSIDLDCYQIEVFDFVGEKVNIPLTYANIAQYLTAKVINTCTQDSCYAKLLLEDKSPPLIVCVNDTITCDKDLERIAKPQVTDCDENPEINPLGDVFIDDFICDGLAIIERTWEAIDTSGNRNTCTQQIHIEQELDFSFPSDTIIECSNVIRDTLPPYSILVDLPNIDTSGFCSFDFTFSEDSIPICEGSYKLIRTFFVTNHCSNEFYHSDSFGNDNKQTIKVVDTQDPEICVADFTISNPQGGDCVLQYLPPPKEVSDNCSDYEVSIITPVGEAIYFDTIDGRYGGVIPYPTLATGMYPVIYTATDDCENVGRDTMQLTIDDRRPFTVCPPDTSIECTKFFELFPDKLDSLGVFAPIDTCGFTVDSIIINNVTSCGEGEYLRSYILSNRTTEIADTCTQTITVTRPRRDVRVLFRQDVDEECTPLEDLRIREPRVRSTDCDDVTISFRDQVFDQVPDACYILIRTWTVINWCTYSPGNPTLGEGLFVDDQVFTVRDTIPPVLDPIPDTTVCITTDCAQRFPFPTVSATDNCSDTLTIQWSTNVDTTTAVPPGTYEAYLTATDGCNNAVFDTVQVTIMDCKAPTAYCRPLSLDLGQQDSLSISAHLFDYGSFDNCNSALRFSYSSDVRDNTWVFDCDSLGMRSISLYITDEAGNQTICETFANITSSVHDCSDERIIAGAIRTATGMKVEGVKINRESQDYTFAMTDVVGDYAFTNCAFGLDYSIIPEKEDDVLNGVTTFDLILINKHILGVTPFTSPYQLIAADINRSGDISTLDVIQLRRVILNIDSTFSHNTSWRFVPLSYSFPATPMAMTDFPEALDFPDLQISKYGADFVAIKIGDVNGSAVNYQPTGTTTRSTHSLNDHSSATPVSIFPNPFFTTTTFNYFSQQRERVELRLFDQRGILLYQKNILTEIGENNILVKLSDDILSGIIIYQLRSEQQIYTGKLLLV